MVKKLLLAFILLVLLVGLSYVKIVRKDEQINNAYTEGKHESEQHLSRIQLDNDSLKTLISQKESEYKDSLSGKEQIYASKTDSLALHIDSLGDTVADLKSKLKSKETQLAKANSPKKSTSTTKKVSKHEQILIAYKKNYRALPTDLSDYERKVAIGEVRSETAHQFKITVAELNRLRTDNNIDF